MSKSKMPIIIVIGVLILAAIALTVFFVTRDDSEDTTEPTTNGQDENGEDQDENNGEDPNGGDDGTAEKVESIKSGVSEVATSLQALDGDFDAAIAAGCGDDLPAFNRNVIDLSTRLGETQESLLALGTMVQSINPDEVSQEDQDAVSAALDEVSGLSLTLEQKQSQLAELSGTCNV